MKKENQNITSIYSNVSSSEDTKKESFKTTNINILLNRVRLDKKRTYKKRIIISFFLATLITSFIVYFII